MGVTLIGIVLFCGSLYLMALTDFRALAELLQRSGRTFPAASGETVLEAAVRETLEESAWEVELTGLVAIYHWVEPGNRRPLIRFTFAARALRERVGAPLDTGIVRALWLGEDEARSGRYAPRSPFVLRSIEDYRARKALPLDALSALDLQAGATISVYRAAQ